jgi:putative nucleotidyltransferase with HDIG domain
MPAATISDFDAFVDQLLQSGALELPMLPSAMAETLALCQSDTADAARLSHVIHRDPTLAANVLKVANSAAFALPVPCASLQQAVARLGLPRIAETALALCVRGTVFSEPSCRDALARLWRHAALSACFAREAARLLRRNVETAFLCGLLHDAGKAVLLTSVARAAGSRGVDVGDLAAALHARHQDVGEQLAIAWKLPDPVAAAIAHHHEPERAQAHGQFAAIACLADLLAHFVDACDGAQMPQADAIRRHPSIALLNLYPDQLQTLFALASKAQASAEAFA